MGRSNQLLAALLGHLAEVEARGIHRTRACASLYTYCIYELRFSEDEAYRRVAAARFVRRFPALLDAVVAGELHLTGLLMLGPHLTEQNLVEVLGRAKHRTKKEIAGLVRLLDPLPEVPPCIEPLGPAPVGPSPPAPTWSEFVRSMDSVRELVPGDRPRDWVERAKTSRRTAAAARLPTLPGAAAVKCTASSCTTRRLSLAAVSTPRRTSRCAAVRTMPWRPRRISAERSSSSGGVRADTRRAETPEA